MKKIVSLWMAAVCLVGVLPAAKPPGALACGGLFAGRNEADQRAAIAGKDGWPS
jgi:hypothetical protein